MKTYEFSKEGYNEAIKDIKKYNKRMKLFKIGGKLIILGIPLALIIASAPELLMMQNSSVAFKLSYETIDTIDSVAFKLLEVGI